MLRNKKQSHRRKDVKMRKIIPEIMILMILLVNVGTKADIVLPYIENFDAKEIGTVFGDWSYPFGMILGSDSNPFGVIVPLDENYLFVSGSQGQSAGVTFSEITNNVDFNLDFCSLPNPNYTPSGAFRGGADFFILADSDYARKPQIGISIDGEMWQTDDLKIYFKAQYLENQEEANIFLGTIEHGEAYDLNIMLNQNIVNVAITGSLTNINYEFVLEQIFPAKEFMIWEGGAPSNEYGLCIDNVATIPEPATLLLLVLGCRLIRKRV